MDTVRPEAPAYPAGLRGQARPPLLSVMGRWPWPAGASVALVASGKAPAGVMLAVHDLAQQWRRDDTVILGGFHAPVEQEALAVLLRGPGPVVVWPARSLPKRLRPAWRDALAAGHLTIVSGYPETVRRATRETARKRNEWVTAVGDRVLIAHARPGSSTFALAQQLLAGGKPVYTLDHPANRALLDLGAGAWVS